MANQSIVLSNGDGRVTFSNTASLWYDDVNAALTGSAVSAGSLTLPSIAANKLMYISGSSILPVVTGTVNNGALVWNSATSQWSASSDIVENYAGVAGGDISGTFGIQGFPKVTNISNVSSGTLSAFYGGTGANIPTGSNILLKATSGSFSYLSASAASSGSFITATSQNGWTIAPPAYQPDVRFYTSGSTGNTFTWTKPAGARFARVILQGAGGGGSSGYSTTGVGSGGGSGGYTDIILEASSISSASVVVGSGGTGGLKSGSGQNGSTGGSSFFGTYSATGGGGGILNGAGGSAGTGVTKNGGKGWAFNGTVGNGFAADTVYGMPSGGANGGAGTVAGTIISFFKDDQKNFGYSIASDSTLIDIKLSSGSIGVASPNIPSKPGFGAGGAGGAITTAGGSGGDGYALIISW